MHREDNTKFLLYIEPKAKDKLDQPIDDDLTNLMEMALSKAKKGSANYSQAGSEARFSPGGAWRGSHQTECGERSNNCDYLLENGMVTNSLAPFYLRWYRYSIPESEMKKVYELKRFYENK
jgi:hypothetical protein